MMSRFVYALLLLLVLSIGSAVLAQDELDGGTLNYGETVEIDADGVLTVVFTFEGSEGDIISITVNSEDDFDSRINLFDPNEDELFVDDDSGGYPNPAAHRIELPESGTYTLMLDNYAGNEFEGDFEVTVEQTELLLLNDGEQTITLGDGTASTDVMDFDVEEGQFYILTVSFSDASDTTLYIEFGEEGDYYPNTRFAISGLVASSFVFEADETGRARLKFQFTGYDEEIEVTVSAEAIDL